MKNILKPSHLREHLRSTSLLGAGLLVGVLALTATDVSAQEAIQTPAAEGVSAPAAESVSDPVTEGASDPAAEGVADSSDAEAGDQESPSSVSTDMQGTDTQVADSGAEPVLDETPAAPQSLLGELFQLLDTPEESSEAGPDLSPMGMYRGADIVVKLVMLGLIFGSIVTWAIWLSKTIEIAGAVGRARRVLRAVNESRSMAEADERVGKMGGPAAAMLRAVQAESAFSEPLVGHVSGAGLKERVSSVLDQISATAGRRAAIGTGLLATIGSTAPFVGLFGTVWGIMNSFIGIAEAQSSSLAVVAPGIAEALLATALGLVAAIPAVIIYNACARWITGYRHTLSEVAAGIERLVSRDLDFRHISAKPSLDAQAAE